MTWCGLSTDLTQLKLQQYELILRFWTQVELYANVSPRANKKREQKGKVKLRKINLVLCISASSKNCVAFDSSPGANVGICGPPFFLEKSLQVFYKLNENHVSLAERWPVCVVCCAPFV